MKLKLYTHAKGTYSVGIEFDTPIEILSILFYLFTSIYFKSDSVVLLGCFLYSIIIFFLHFVTDFVTSKYTHKYFSKSDYHKGFVVVGLDQWLHCVQLILTYQFIFK